MSYLMNTTGVNFMIDQQRRAWHAAAAQDRLAHQLPAPETIADSVRASFRRAGSRLAAILSPVGALLVPAPRGAEYRDAGANNR